MLSVRTPYSRSASPISRPFPGWAGWATGWKMFGFLHFEAKPEKRSTRFAPLLTSAGAPCGGNYAYHDPALETLHREPESQVMVEEIRADMGDQLQRLESDHYYVSPESVADQRAAAAVEAYR